MFTWQVDDVTLWYTYLFLLVCMISRWSNMIHLVQYTSLSVHLTTGWCNMMYPVLDTGILLSVHMTSRWCITIHLVLYTSPLSIHMTSRWCITLCTGTLLSFHMTSRWCNMINLCYALVHFCPFAWQLDGVTRYTLCYTLVHFSSVSSSFIVTQPSLPQESSLVMEEVLSGTQT